MQRMRFEARTQAEAPKHLSSASVSDLVSEREMCWMQSPIPRNKDRSTILVTPSRVYTEDLRSV